MNARRSADVGGPIDPRYDPAFQRGAENTRDGGFRVSLEHAAANPGPRPVPETGFPPDTGSPRGSGSAPVSGIAPSDPVQPFPQPEGSPARVLRRWLAYSVVIASVSGACLAFGVVLVVSAYTAYNSTSLNSAQDYFWPQLAAQFGPWFFVVGLASGIGLLFLHASSWRPER